MQPFLWKDWVKIKKIILEQLMQGILAVSLFVYFRLPVHYLLYTVGPLLFFLYMKGNVLLDLGSNTENLLVLPYEPKVIIRLKLNALMVYKYVCWIIYSVVYVLIMENQNCRVSNNLWIDLVILIFAMFCLYELGYYCLTLSWLNQRRKILVYLFEGIYLTIINLIQYNLLWVLAYIVLGIGVRWLAQLTIRKLNYEQLFYNNS